MSAVPLKIEAQITKLYKNNHFALFFAIFKIVLIENTHTKKIQNCFKWFILNVLRNEIMEIFESTTKILRNPHFSC